MSELHVLKSKSIDEALADRVAEDFAREHGRSKDDPIVRDLRRGIKRSLGLTRWRNKIAAERTAGQTTLFPRQEIQMPGTSNGTDQSQEPTPETKARSEPIAPQGEPKEQEPQAK